MQRKRFSELGIFHPRIVVAILLCVTGMSLAVLSLAEPLRPKGGKISPVKIQPIHAPTPASSGTIDAAHPTLTYSDGPFVVPNATAQAGAPDCTVPMSCSDFTLTVASTDQTKQVRISISWPLSTADFDLYVYNGDPALGSLAGTSASSADPEVVILPAPTVTSVYTIRVVPFAPAGQTYTANVSLEAKPSVPVAGTAPAPRYQDYPPNPSNLAGAGSAGEPSIGVDWNPNVASLQNITPQTPGTPPMNGIRLNAAGVAFFTANLNEYRVNFDDCSSPAATLWEDVTNATESVQTLDPIGFVDHQIPGETGPAANGAGVGRIFQSQLAGATSITSFSDQDGNSGSYSQSQGSGQPAGVDHQTLGGGPYAPSNPNAVPPVIEPPHTYPHQIYYASQDIGTSFAARSDNGGQTFGPGIPMYNITQCGGLHGHIKVGPDGTVYLPNKSCGSGTAVVVSRDNGLTWTVKPIPGSTSGSTDPSVGIGADNTVYVGYQNGDGHPHIAVSTNHGDTFHDVDVSQNLITHCVFPQVIAADGDRAAFGFLGTNGIGSPDDTNGFTGVWYEYIATTIDRGQTYTLVDATNGDPVQIGSVCTAGTTCGDDRNLLDFADIQIDKEGRALMAIADGCIAPTCNASIAAAHAPPYPESRAALSTVIRQSGGPRLLSAFDAQVGCGGSPLTCTPILAGAPRVDSVVRTGSNVHLEWSQPDNGGSPLTGYHVFRKVGANGTYAVIATVTQNCPACKTSYDDGTADPNLQYFYKITALTAAGESPSCGEFPVSAAGPIESPCLPPGLTILTDPSNDELDQMPGHDAQSLQISEPFALAPNKVLFTLKVQSLAVMPPNTRWPVTFSGPNGVNYTVRMTNSAVDGASTTPIFQVGPTAGPFVAADPASNYSVDGSIRIVVPSGSIGVTATGQQLSGFVTRIMIVGDLVNPTPDNMPDSFAPTGSYTIVGNAFCAPNTAPIAALIAYPVGSAPGTQPTGNPPLAIQFDASGSRDPDAGDSIASYTFDFGDGSTAVTQSSPTVQHTYQSNGNFRATVTVKDSRGLVSSNVAGVNIVVNLPLTRVVSEKTHGSVTPAFDVILFDPIARPDGTGEIECRTEGNGYLVIYSFSSEFTVTGQASTTPTITNGGTVASHGPGPGANQYQILFTGVTNAQRHTITLSGVPVTNSNKSNASATLNNATARLDLLVGDVDQSSRTDSGDVTAVRQHSVQIPSQATFRFDVDASGRTDAGDVTVTRQHSVTTFP